MGRNLAKIQYRKKPDAEFITYTTGELEFTDRYFRMCRFKGVEFKSPLAFDECKFEKVEFEECTFVGPTFRGCIFTDPVSIVGCQGTLGIYDPIGLPKVDIEAKGLKVVIGEYPYE